MHSFIVSLRATCARRRLAHASTEAQRSSRNETRSRGRLALAALADEGTSESGLSLIEVIVSALMIALISMAVVSGFLGAGRATADERSHGQATLVAAQDQERLRTLSPKTLVQLGNETYTVNETGARCSLSSTTCAKGITFTIESRSEYVSGNAVENAKKEEEDVLTCSAGENAAPSFIKTTSKVTWKEVGVANEVRQSSLVAVPNGSAVEVKVVDQKGEPVNGATVTATGTTTNLTQTTVKQGCVVFGAIADKTVEVDAAKSGWVGTQGITPPAKSVTPSESLSATEFTIAAPGALQAKFSSNGATGASGETIFAAQSKLGAKGFVAGVAGTPATAVTMSGLYPFVSPNTYTVYAGDCEENNPEVVTAKAVKDQPGVQIEPGVTSNVEVEVPPVNVVVMSGTKAGASTAGTAVTSTSAKLINKACASKTTQTGATIPYEHTIKVEAGKLAPRYAPYAASLELCVVFKEGTTYYKNKTTFANTKKEGLAETPFYVKGTGVTSSTSALSC